MESEKSAALPGSILQLKVRVLGISPMIWRRVLVPDSMTLRELHGVVQLAMGWEGIHLFEFVVRGVRYAGADPTDFDASYSALRGAPMTSKCTAQLLADLGVTRSLSRPQVSDDNPFSEAQFKTLKYHPGFPGRFDDIGATIAFCRSFFPWYNTEHRHAGIAMLNVIVRTNLAMTPRGKP